MNDVLNIANEHIAKRKKLTIGVINAAKIVNIQKYPELRASFEEADLILADGMPIVWLSRMLSTPLPERVAGIDFMFKLLKEADKKHYSIYFLGAKPNVLQKVIETIQREYPRVRIAGYRDGYFNADEEQRVADNIRDSHPDILFVGISSPKKENFLKRWHHYMNVPICHGVGGSFDVIAGTTKRAPLWMRKCGLEWFYRLIQEPRRMWKRYLVTNTIFIQLALGAIIQAKFNSLFSRFANRP